LVAIVVIPSLCPLLSVSTRHVNASSSGWERCCGDCGGRRWGLLAIPTTTL
jgi:hypothetical protein